MAKFEINVQLSAASAVCVREVDRWMDPVEGGPST